MLKEIIRFVTVKSIGSDLVKMAAKNSNHNGDVVREKLGVSSIDEFMKMDIRDYKKLRVK
jgi:hypothetical protein